MSLALRMTRFPNTVELSSLSPIIRPSDPAHSVTVHLYADLWAGLERNLYKLTATPETMPRKAPTKSPRNSVTSSSSLQFELESLDSASMQVISVQLLTATRT